MLSGQGRAWRRLRCQCLLAAIGRFLWLLVRADGQLHGLASPPTMPQSVRIYDWEHGQAPSVAWMRAAGLGPVSCNDMARPPRAPRGMAASKRHHLQDFQHVVDAGGGRIRVLRVGRPFPRPGFGPALPTDGRRGAGTGDGCQGVRRRLVRRAASVPVRLFAAAAFGRGVPTRHERGKRNVQRREHVGDQRRQRHARRLRKAPDRALRPRRFARAHARAGAWRQHPPESAFPL